ncbi:MAG TPA: hypothetical protein VFZ75_04475 [Actinomycetota bacterium]|nr:hypothetical protein [Actinomycetota bacterium]
MRFERFTFGSIEVDGTTYEHDLVIDRGSVRKRRKGPSKPYRERFGHTPLSADEDIPWACRRLVIGNGASGSLPVMDEVVDEAERRGVELVILSTREALDQLRGDDAETNAILHLTC